MKSYYKLDEEGAKKLDVCPDLKEGLKVFIEYLVEFDNYPYVNIQEAALDKTDPKLILWRLEIEPFSATSFGNMRTNVYNLCIKLSNEELRKFIIDGEKASFGSC